MRWLMLLSMLPLGCELAPSPRESEPTSDDAPAIVRGCLDRAFADVLAKHRGHLFASGCESNDKGAERRVAESAFKIGASAMRAESVFTSSGLVDGSSAWPKEKQDELAERHRRLVEELIKASDATRAKLADSSTKAGCIAVDVQLEYFDAGTRCALTNDREGEKPYLAGFVSACVESGGKESRADCEAAGRVAFKDRIDALRKKAP